MKGADIGGDEQRLYNKHNTKCRDERAPTRFGATRGSSSGGVRRADIDTVARERQ